MFFIFACFLLLQIYDYVVSQQTLSSYGAKDKSKQAIRAYTFARDDELDNTYKQKMDRYIIKVPNANQRAASAT